MTPSLQFLAFLLFVSCFMIVFATLLINLHHKTYSPEHLSKKTDENVYVPFKYIQPIHAISATTQCPKISYTRPILTGYFQDTSPILPSIKKQSSFPIPFVIMTSKRYKYLQRTIDSLRQATIESIRQTTIESSSSPNLKRTCIYIVDRTKHSRGTTYENEQIDLAINSSKTFCNVITKIRYIVNNNGNRLRRSKHLKSHWLWSMTQIFTSLLPADYNGDVLLLEDDVTVSPDIFNVVEYALLVRQSGKPIVGRDKKYIPIVTALGGWNGEHLFSPHPLHFRTIKGRAFPTLGYAFNRSLFNLINSIKKEIIQYGDNDWTTAVSISLQNNAMEKYKHPIFTPTTPTTPTTPPPPPSSPTSSKLSRSSIAPPSPVELHIPCDGVGEYAENSCNFIMIQPTLSRVHHIGASSQVGNSHNKYLKACSPWSTMKYQNLLYNINLGKHIGELSNLQGLPCRENHEQNSNTIYDDLKTILFDSSLRLFNISMDNAKEDVASSTNASQSIQAKNLQFFHLLLDSMFVQSGRLERREKYIEVPVNSCRLLSKYYPSCNSEIGRSNRWASTFYPNTMRWDIISASTLFEVVFLDQIKHLNHCSKISKEMLLIWPEELKQYKPYNWSTSTILLFLVCIVIGLPLLCVLLLHYVEEEEEVYNRRVKRRKKKNNRKYGMRSQHSVK